MQFIKIIGINNMTANNYFAPDLMFRHICLLKLHAGSNVSAQLDHSIVFTINKHK